MRKTKNRDGFDWLVGIATVVGCLFTIIACGVAIYQLPRFVRKTEDIQRQIDTMVVIQREIREVSHRDTVVVMQRDTIEITRRDTVYLPSPVRPATPAPDSRNQRNISDDDQRRIRKQEEDFRNEVFYPVFGGEK